MTIFTRLRKTGTMTLSATLLALGTQASAAEQLDVVTSFTLLADMAENVGGEHVKVTSLIGPDSNAHSYAPSPGDVRTLSKADVVVFNGLHFEGWMERLLNTGDYQGITVVATDGIDVLAGGHDHHDHGNHHRDHNDHNGHQDHNDHRSHNDHDGHSHERHNHEGRGHEEHAHEHEGHDHGPADPHAWQDVGRARTYVTNIRDGLIEADAEHAEAYRANAQAYLAELEQLDTEIQRQMSDLPEHATVITGHASFDYFADAYGLHFMAPEGLATSATPSAARMAGLVDVIHERNIQALFYENMGNTAVIDQLAEDSGLTVAGTLYAGALAAEGEASTYLGMMRHNARVLHEALTAGTSSREERTITTEPAR